MFRASQKPRDGLFPKSLLSSASVFQGKLKGHLARGGHARAWGNWAPSNLANFYKCILADCLHPTVHPLTAAYCFQHIFPMASFSLIIEAKLDSNGFAQKRASSASSLRTGGTWSQQRAICWARLILSEARAEGPMRDRGDPPWVGTHEGPQDGKGAGSTLGAQLVSFPK